MPEIDPITQEFLVESMENLEEVDRDLVGLEKDPENTEKMNRIFRAIHTIKGTCGFLDFNILQDLSHSGEHLLSTIRNGDIAIRPNTTSLLLRLADAIREILKRIESSGSDSGEDYSELKEELTRAAALNQEEKEAAPATDPEKETPATRTKKPAPPPKKVRKKSPTKITIVDENIVEESPEKAKKENTPEPNAKVQTRPPSSSPPTLHETFVRVDVRVLDRLMNLVGELVLTRNQLLGSNTSDPIESAAIQQLDHITGELQAGIMQTRMQPVSKVLGRFPRLVRDLAASCNKKAELTIEGQETELDRSLIEAIRDPLTHLVRNAVDHGLETPAERKKASKPEIGRIWVRAFHESGQVTLEIGDDGRGIDFEEIRHKAIENGIIHREVAEKLDRDECLRLLFTPGFSTSSSVSNISGRGVGLDVVRSNIEHVNGMIDIESRPGQGSVFRLRLPLTLAIMPAIILRSATQRFAIPQSSVRELVRPGDGDEGRRIEKVHGAAVLRLRGHLLPLLSLSDELQVKSDSKRGAPSILVLQAGDRNFGLIIDDVEDTQEIVVKPLGPPLDRIPIYAGATIMGDGEVALILDTLGLAQRAHVIAETSEIRSQEETPVPVTEAKEGFLVFRSPDDGRMAIPLAPLIRLEKLKEKKIEHLGSTIAIQYRGDILPLVPVLELLPERRKKIRTVKKVEGEINVAIYESGGQTVGLLIGPIVDIVEEEIEIRRPASREGVSQCIVVNERVTELLDVDLLVEKAQLPLARKLTQSEDLKS